MGRPSLLLVVVAGAAVLPAPGAAAAAWQRPVDGPVLRLFSVGPDRFARGQHRGVDLAASPGSGVRAACGGRVSFAGRVPRGGLTLSVRCGRFVATYQHLGAAFVRRGQVVLPGGRIGTVGSARPRPHLHLGAREIATAAYVDPLSLLNGAPRPLPPPLPAARRPLPLGPAPDARAPARTGPATVRRVPHPVASAREARPAEAGARERLPWPVWAGLALLGLGLPLGGIVRVRERRRRAAAPRPQTAS